MVTEPRTRRDMSREQLVFPPHGRTSRGSKWIFVIFFATIVAIMALALYVTFYTDSREKAVNALNTETAEVYNTAAANSTSTAAALAAMSGGAPTVPSGIASSPAAASTETAVATVDAP